MTQNYHFSFNVATNLIVGELQNTGSIQDNHFFSKQKVLEFRPPKNASPFLSIEKKKNFEQNITTFKLKENGRLFLEILSYLRFLNIKYFIFFSSFPKSQKEYWNAH